MKIQKTNNLIDAAISAAEWLTEAHPGTGQHERGVKLQKAVDEFNRKDTYMTRDKAIQKLRDCPKFDTESAHMYADDVLCDLLTSLGYEDVVKEWKSINKWFP